MPTGTAIFLDTSIQIARIAHSPQTKEHIARQLAGYDLIISSLTVKQEYKRRFLWEIQYLLGKLEDYESFQEVYYHVVRLPDHYPKQKRKKNTCLQILGIGSAIPAANDAEQTERFLLKLRYLMLDGLDQFDEDVGAIKRGSECGCARLPVREKTPFRRYLFPEEKCSKLRAGSCGIAGLMGSRRLEIDAILNHLGTLPEGTEPGAKTQELQNAEVFIRKVLANPDTVASLDPCLTVGDLCIALESVGVPVFYTLNGKESQHLCRALRQTLIVRPVNPIETDIECRNTDQRWQAF
jgi:hypothetical protein